ncbi:hypothetical protein VTP01DRAFT_9705 [Rhizomucor pusillus]|uniref:uncharacterized protein n=1 Tax=Rhizomucor pusillus TaxID=4840 RepID=UPI0037428936
MRSMKGSPRKSQRTSQAVPTTVDQARVSKRQAKSHKTTAQNGNLSSTQNQPVSPDMRHLTRRLKDHIQSAAIQAPLASDTTRHSGLQSPYIPNNNNADGSSQDAPLARSSSSSSSDSQPRLNNLQLLKQYLTSVAQECNATIKIKQTASGKHAVELVNSCYPQDKEKLSGDDRRKVKAAETSARLIEAFVHDETPSLMSAVIDSQPSFPTASDRSSLPTARNRKCGGSIPAALPNSANRMRQLPNSRRRHSRAQRQQADVVENVRRSRRKRSKKSIPEFMELETIEESSIRCVCEQNDEEFGAMVQCDDCRNWLHLECLELKIEDLGEAFRCPYCYVKLGPGEKSKLMSNVNWRFAAHCASKELADAYQKTLNDVESDNDESATIPHTTASSSSTYASSYSSSSMNAASVSTTTTASVTNTATTAAVASTFGAGFTYPLLIPSTPSTLNDSNNDVDVARLQDIPRRISEGTVSLVDDHSESASGSDFVSEVSTPPEDGNSEPVNLFPSAHLLQSGLADLAYFTHLINEAFYSDQPTPAFSENGTDVFLCDDGRSSSSSTNPPATISSSLRSSSASSPSHSALPSSLCSADLRQYSFEYSPFWYNQQ